MRFSTQPMRRRAVTLTEIIVVISIIVLMAGFSFYAFPFRPVR